MRFLHALALSFLLAWASHANAAILFLKGTSDALHVRTIRETDTSIVVGVPQADGAFVERVIDRRIVDQFIRTVSTERLTSLDPAKPAMYRDYAEELAEKKIDPDARDAAIRLYLIAAHLDADNLGRSALLGMTSLARSPAEQRKFRAMVYLLDPKHDRSVLRADTPAAAASTSAEEAEGRENLIAALRLLRQGNRRVARRMATRPSVEAALRRWGREFSRDDFLAACDSSEDLDSATLARVIRFELALLGAEDASKPAEADGKSAGWSATLAAGDTAPAPTLTLKSLTEFDPELCVYRDGKWVKPSE